MVIEGLRLLRRFASFSRYRFVGFGGVRFADLLLVHQQLGITRMVSIEHEADGPQQERLRFNKPLKSIELVGESNDLLPERNGPTPQLRGLTMTTGWSLRH